MQLSCVTYVLFDSELRICVFLTMAIFISGSQGGYMSSSNAFLFSFKNHDNLKPFKAKVMIKKIVYAVFNNGGYLPTFGGGHDIHIANNAGSNTNSYSNLFHSYIQVLDYSAGSTKAMNLLAGSRNFQPNELEVFRQAK